MIVPTVVAGVVVGVAAWLLKWLIGGTAALVTASLHIGGGNWWLVPVAVVGIMSTGWFVRHVVKMPLEFGTDRLKASVAQGDGIIPARMMFAPICASSLTLGFGGSAGSEGPIAYTGAAIASNMGRWFGMNRRQLVIAAACGGGAGIAAIFKSPVGGFFFTMEILRMSLGLQPVFLLAVMCITSALTAYTLSGDTYDFTLYLNPQFSWHQAPMLLLMAAVCGAYSVYYLATGLWSRRKLQAMATPWRRNLASGLALGLILFMFPAMYGEGYGVLGLVANGDVHSVAKGSILGLFKPGEWLVPLSMAGILLLKGLAAYTTNSGGGVAGSFAPTLYAGGIFGGLFAHISGLPLNLTVVCGMGAAMAGITRAPLMAIFLTCEMTGQQQMLLPVTLCAAVSYTVSRLLCPPSAPAAKRSNRP